MYGARRFLSILTLLAILYSALEGGIYVTARFATADRLRSRPAGFEAVDPLRSRHARLVRRSIEQAHAYYHAPFTCVLTLSTVLWAAFVRQPNIAMEDSRKKEFEDYITERFPAGSKRSTGGVVYAAFGAAGYEAGRYALTEYLTGFKAGWGATNGCNPVSRL